MCEEKSFLKFAKRLLSSVLIFAIVGVPDARGQIQHPEGHPKRYQPAVRCVADLIELVRGGIPTPEQRRQFASYLDHFEALHFSNLDRSLVSSHPTRRNLALGSESSDPEAELRAARQILGIKRSLAVPDAEIYFKQYTFDPNDPDATQNAIDLWLTSVDQRYKHIRPSIDGIPEMLVQANAFAFLIWALQTFHPEVFAHHPIIQVLAWMSPAYRVPDMAIKLAARHLRTTGLQLDKTEHYMTHPQAASSQGAWAMTSQSSSLTNRLYKLATEGRELGKEDLQNSRLWTGRKFWDVRTDILTSVEPSDDGKNKVVVTVIARPIRKPRSQINLNPERALVDQAIYHSTTQTETPGRKFSRVMDWFQIGNHHVFRYVEDGRVNYVFFRATRYKNEYEVLDIEPQDLDDLRREYGTRFERIMYALRFGANQYPGTRIVLDPDEIESFAKAIEARYTNQPIDFKTLGAELDEISTQLKVASGFNFEFFARKRAVIAALAASLMMFAPNSALPPEGATFRNIAPIFVEDGEPK